MQFQKEKNPLIKKSIKMEILIMEKKNSVDW